MFTCLSVESISGQEYWWFSAFTRDKCKGYNFTAVSAVDSLLTDSSVASWSIN